MAVTFDDAVVVSFLRWAAGFASGLTEAQQGELESFVLKFVSSAFAPAEPPFSVEAAYDGSLGESVDVSIGTLIQAFRYYEEQGDQERSLTTGMLVWQWLRQIRNLGAN